ncbi:uncharacterized protein EURHEDRAFT_456786 [Aspergillus ruber CBS 135680]|uniref:Uncharacterized protein n=1 Tax=Aspergillus ruber (strain CBS 135680) TaxID=1388766 RepID=A0A017SF64_ASPRC|nr:uncharacterized protein EURHEDRAFT_456786 [Aspergillus ruber CBS 135680]EYE94900.1 hypothetical protein EURHEDRAFT_456786 [Aspergillus ruber CBS 135680]
MNNQFPVSSQTTTTTIPTAPSPPRHWHGSIGDRHEHHNVWVRGGSPQVYYPARRASSSSEASTSSMDRRTSSANTPSNPSNQNTAPPSVGDRRRSSNAMLFSGLSTQKRDPLNTNMATRRESWKEQSNQGGFLSKWWDGYTKGH